MNNINMCKNSLISCVLHSWRSKRFINKINLTKNFYTSRNDKLPQPTPMSHPHLLKTGEVTAAISKESYLNRRQNLIEGVCKKMSLRSENNVAHLVVIPSSSVVYMTQEIPYTFRQNSDFLYLCGLKEPNCILVITCDPQRTVHKSVLFMSKQTTNSIKWEGQKMDLLDITKFLGVDQALYVSQFEKFLESFVQSHKQFSLWYDYMGQPFQLAKDSMTNFISSLSGRFSVESPRSIIHHLRLIKSNEEIDLMRKSCEIAAISMTEVLKFSKPNIPEAHLQAKMDYECRLRGADYSAFPAVVAGGNRAIAIHYIENHDIIKDNDMVLMDAGCEYHGYTSDMTRTWPVNGKFTDSQKELYQLLLEVQKELIKKCSTNLSLDELFVVMCKKLGKGLQELNIIEKSLSESQVVDAAFELCPHHVSHYLGMDVHDTSLISRSIKLRPGMIVTVEPGVYIPMNYKNGPEKYKGLGIRIEDDILITEQGNEVLTSDCPKDVDVIEKLLKK